MVQWSILMKFMEKICLRTPISKLSRRLFISQITDREEEERLLQEDQMVEKIHAV